MESQSNWPLSRIVEAGELLAGKASARSARGNLGAPPDMSKYHMSAVWRKRGTGNGQ